MVAPTFGFSVGDFIAGTKLLASILGAFKSAGGASSKFSSEVAFLLSLASTIQQLEDYLERHQSDDTSKGIVKLLQLIEKPLAEFKTFLDKYTEALDAAGKDHESRFRKAQKTISYTVKDLSGKVEKLRREIEQPLNAINTLLSLHLIKMIENLSDEPLRPEQCAQIVNAIMEADISTELDKQIKVLQQSANEHSLEHDEHSEKIQELKRELDEGLTSLRNNLGNLADAIADKLADREGHQAASDEVQTSLNLLNVAFEGNTTRLDAYIREQETLLIAIEAFLEDKSAVQVAAMEPEPSIQDKIKPGCQDTSWPAATLPAAHLVISLLSVVVSGVVAVTVTRLKRETTSATISFLEPTTIPAVSLPAFERNPLVFVPSGPLLEEGDLRASAWKDDFAISSVPSIASNLPTTLPLPAPKALVVPMTISLYSAVGTAVRTAVRTAVGTPAGWSNKISKLDENVKANDQGGWSGWDGWGGGSDDSDSD